MACPRRSPNCLRVCLDGTTLPPEQHELRLTTTCRTGSQRGCDSCHDRNASSDLDHLRRSGAWPRRFGTSTTSATPMTRPRLPGSARITDTFLHGFNHVRWWWRWAHERPLVAIRSVQLHTPQSLRTSSIGWPRMACLSHTSSSETMLISFALAGSTPTKESSTDQVGHHRWICGSGPLLQLFNGANGLEAPLWEPAVDLLLLASCGRNLTLMLLRTYPRPLREDLALKMRTHSVPRSSH